jgi:hypothetical protein
VCEYQFFDGLGTDWKTISKVKDEKAFVPWSDPHATGVFRYFVLVLGNGTRFRGYLLEHD